MMTTRSTRATGTSAEPGPRELAAELKAVAVAHPPGDESTRAAAVLAWLTARLAENPGAGVLLTYGAAWDLLRPGRPRRGARAYTPMLRVAAGLPRLDVPGLGPVALDTFIVNAQSREPGDGHWDDVDYTRSAWRRAFAGAALLRPDDLA
jgi:hypothetical protein